MAAEHMTPKPVMSVCIANYNGMQFIDACLRSVFEQDCEFSFEIIIHDDASTDGSADYIGQRYPNVTLIRSTDNVGFCVANNRMVAASRGEYVLLLNNDAELFSDALSTLRTEAVELGRQAILGLPQYDAETGRLLDRGSLLDPFLNPVPNLDEKRQDVGMVMGSCLWLPKALWDELGGFPEWFGSIGEDLYLCCRARLCGYQVHISVRSGYRHWVGKSFGGGKVSREKRLTTTFERRALSERNKTFTMAVTYPLPILIPILPLHLLVLMIEGMMLSLLRANSEILITVYLSVINAIWTHRKTLACKRTELQNQANIVTSHFAAVFTLFPYKLLMLFKYGVPIVKWRDQQNR